MTYITEIDRILKQNGYFLCISYGVQDYRLQYFENDYDWEIKFDKVPKPILDNLNEENKLEEKNNPMNYHYIYICHKKVLNWLLW